MNSDKNKRIIYTLGIGLGIIIVVAFISSQIVYPLLLGRPGKVEVPNVTGMNLAQAKRVLHEKRLHVVVRDSVWSEEAKVEMVLEQQPAPGEQLKHDHAVNLVISRGTRQVSVPNVVGQLYQQAYVQLRNKSLKAVIADSLYSDSYPVNAVLRTSPSSGSKVLKESSVRLFLSRGPEPQVNYDDEPLFPEDAEY
ncbi:MAG TPA: PASTA domain-containing protein [Candidatus Cloacimonadota bacterium]|nr:PASTA domain-containing protein [Candidatus Cloacimonadota bacterium]